jgi:hypothetical protein
MGHRAHIFLHTPKSSPHGPFRGLAVIAEDFIGLARINFTLKLSNAQAIDGDKSISRNMNSS